MAENLGLVIKSLRDRNKVKQHQLAERVGIGSSFLSQIENGKAYPSKPVLDKIAEELGMPTAILNLLALDFESVPEEKRKKLENSYKRLKSLVKDAYDLVV